MMFEHTIAASNRDASIEDIQTVLNAFSKDGWELVSVVAYTNCVLNFFFFKRPKRVAVAGYKGNTQAVGTSLPFVPSDPDRTRCGAV